MSQQQSDAFGIATYSGVFQWRTGTVALVRGRACIQEEPYDTRGTIPGGQDQDRTRNITHLIGSRQKIENIIIVKAGCRRVRADADPQREAGQ
jgi:hypothetical protein